MNNIKVLEEVLGLLQTLHETIGVPEGESLIDKNVLGGEDATKNDRVKTVLRSDEQKRVASISKIFAETFLKVQKKYTPDEKPDTLIKQMNRQRQKPMAEAAKKEKTPALKFSALMGGLMLLLGGAWALFKGLFDSEELKGAFKLLSKIGIKGGLKLIMKGVGGLVKMIGRFITAPFKMVGKLFGGGLLGKIFKALKPLAKIFRRIPILGSLISIGFAISRFMNGDNVGGVIDVLSALTGLLYLVPGGGLIAFPLSLGLDLLNTWLDVKAADPKNAGRSKLDLLKDMGAALGKFIWKHAEWIPVLGGIKRLGESYKLFKSGNIKEGLYQFGTGILSLVGPATIITGLEMLMGMTGGDKQDDGSLTPNKSWFSKLKDWIKLKLQDLPYVLRKPLEWFGILDGDDGDIKIEGDGKNEAYEKLKKTANGFWGGFTDKLEEVKGVAGKAAKGMVDGAKKHSGYIADNFKGALKDTWSDTKGVFTRLTDNFRKPEKPETDKPDNHKNLSDKERRLKASGWDTWEEYKAADWKYKKKAETPVVNAPIIAEKKTITDSLVKIGLAQHEMLKNIYNVNFQTLKSINKLGGGANVTHVTNMPTPSGGGSTPRVSMPDNRSGFIGSPYALA